MGEVGGDIVGLAGNCVLLFEVDVVCHCGRFKDQVERKMQRVKGRYSMGLQEKAEGVTIPDGAPHL